MPFPSGLAKRREASPAAIRAKVRAERVDSTALVLAVPAAEAVEQRKLLLEDARSDPLLQGETVTRILQFQKDRAAVEANDKARRAKAMKRYDRRWKHLINLHDFLTQVWRVSMLCVCVQLWALAMIIGRERANAPLVLPHGPRICGTCRGGEGVGMCAVFGCGTES